MSHLQFFLKNRPSLLIFISILAVYGISCYDRQAGYQYWMDNRQDYVVDQVTAMSTMDAYHWLKMARDMDNGRLGKGQVDPLQGYPDGEDYTDKPSLLAKLISLCKNFTGGDYYRAALLLVPILAGLFVFPLFVYFRHLGFGASAVLGGLIGSFSHAYYDRTLTGRPDTDLLNTFFPLAVSSFILLMNRERTPRTNIVLALGAGLSMYLFNWWYQQPGFILAYLVIMFVYLISVRVPWRQVAVILSVFLLASGPVYVMQSVDSLRQFWWGYFSPLPTGKIVWPDAMTFITEAQHLGLLATLRLTYGFLPVVFAGFAGLVYLAIRRWRQMIPIAPLVILGLWALVGQKRFAMYLAPLIGIGVGVLIELLIKYGGEKIKLKPQFVPLASISLMFALFFATIDYTGFGLKIQPSLPSSMTRAFLDIKRLVPKHSAIFTPLWDYGYPLMEIGEFATYHDGSQHGDIRTTLISKAVTSTEQSEMVSTLAYLEDYGFDHLSKQIADDNMSADRMMELVFDYPGNFRGENVYVLYLETMIEKFVSISKYGTWDFTRKKSDPMSYRSMTCFSLVDNILTCKGGKVDLNRGVIISDKSMEVPLKAVLFVNNGYVVDGKDYGSDQGYYLQILEKNNNVIKVQIVDERLFRTNFNQQYLLGNYDRRYFEEVYNDFPVARVLKAKRGRED